MEDSLLSCVVVSLFPFEKNLLLLLLCCVACVVLCFELS